MNYHIKLASFCSTCPNRRFGLCQILLEQISNQWHPQTLQRVLVKAKQHLFRQGNQLDGTFILREGWIQLYRITEPGKREVFPSILPGEILGLYVEDQATAAYSAKALQDSVFCKIPNLVSLCGTNSKLALRLAGLCEFDNLKAEMYLANVAHCDAKERVAFLILELYRRLELRGLNKGFTIPFPLMQADIADMLGLTTVHVNRTLAVLKAEGLFVIQKHELTILDFQALYSLVGEYLEPINECYRNCMNDCRYMI